MEKKPRFASMLGSYHPPQGVPRETIESALRLVGSEESKRGREEGGKTRQIRWTRKTNGDLERDRSHEPTR